MPQWEFRNAIEHQANFEACQAGDHLCSAQMQTLLGDVEDIASRFHCLAFKPDEAERPALDIALLAFAIKFGDATEAFLCRPALG